jgi:hypothetical protein
MSALHLITAVSAGTRLGSELPRTAVSECSNLAADSGSLAECCAPPPLVLPPRPDRLPLIREAFRLEWFTIAWMIVEAVVATGAGSTAGSLVLVAFGLDSVIELASAGVLMWRLSVELHHGQAFSERAERVASRTGGALLFILAGYVTVMACWHA